MPVRRAAGRKVGYAVIGLGHIAQSAVLPGFRNARGSSRLAALVSSDRRKRAELSKRYGVPAFDPGDLEECLALPEVDAAYVAEPNDLHEDYVVRCARAGVNVLCEKPLATSEEACDRILRACDEAGVQLMTAYRLHFEPSNLAVIELARKGRLGDLRYFSSDFSYQVRKDNIRTSEARGGGALWDLGPYCINAARYLFRADPVEVYAIRVARREDPRFTEVHEGMSAVMKFPHDRVATFNVSFGAATQTGYRLVGAKGKVELENAYEYVGPRTLRVTIDEKTRTRKFKPADQFGAEIEAFSRALLAGREIEADGDEGLRDVRVIEAILRSAREGRPVRLSWAPRRRRPEPRMRIKRPAVREPPLVHAQAPAAE